MHSMNLFPMPVTPVEKLAVRFQDYLHLPDPSVLYVLMGAVAANMMEGNPVWLMLVGPPSCGKSEFLNTLLDIPHIVEAADIASEAAFLSATPAREKAADATGGLLRQVGEHGGLILNDFTSVLCKPPDKISMIMGVFREAYGGRWTRHVGGEGGRSLTWAGRLALFAGVTGKIDQYHAMSAELGERWVYWRWVTTSDGFPELMIANQRSREWREELRQVVVDFFAQQGLSFGGHNPSREITGQEHIRIHDIATIAVRCRSAVARDNFNKEILGTKQTELTTRIASVLSQLMLGMERIGVPASIRWTLMSKIAMDSMPHMRKVAIESVASSSITMETLTHVLGCDPNPVKRMVRDLEVQGILVRKGTLVGLSPWMSDNYRKVYSDHRGALSCL